MQRIIYIIAALNLTSSLTKKLQTSMNIYDKDEILYNYY